MVNLLMRNMSVLRSWEKKGDGLLFIFMLKPSYFWTFGGLSVEEGLMLQRSRFRLNIKGELLQSEMSLARKHSAPHHSGSQRQARGPRGTQQRAFRIGKGTDFEISPRPGVNSVRGIVLVEDDIITCVCDYVRDCFLC